MAPCVPASPSRRPILRQVAVRVLAAAFAACIGILIPDAWATPAATTTTLTVTSSGSGVTSVASGTVVTLTATVVSGSTAVNPGQVKFCVATAAHCEDSALLATAQLTTAGTATYKFHPGLGSHSYQAIFVGTSSYAKSTSASAALTVTGLFPTTTAISSSGSVGNYTLNAMVTGTGGGTLSPTGQVSFLDTTNGNASLGSSALEPAAVQSFAVSSVPVPGNEPLYVAVGDFNGDGILDFATANQADTTVTLMLGNGDGTFTFKSSPDVVDTPGGCIAVSDFNGDGIPDLAVTTNDINDHAKVVVLLGKGDGTFTTKSTLTVGDNPQFIAVGDFNGDGIPDLATSDQDDNTVTVLLGNGDGTFTTKSTLAVAGAPVTIVVSDFNGDGILDLAVANSAIVR